MDHAEARELLEIAALEPNGLERLTAGDTPAAATLAGHLVACQSCAEELERLRRVGALLRTALADDAAGEDAQPPVTPAPELRDRTLAYVRELGRVRDPTGAAHGAATADLRERSDRRPLPVPRWLAVAAVIVLAVGLGGLLVGFQFQQTIDRQEASIGGLARAGTAALRIAAQPDSRTVALAGTAGADAAGTLVFSPSSGELVVMTRGVAAPPAGSEYGCWVEVDGQRRRLGRMYVAGEVGYWAGSVDGLADLPPGAVFGVSLVDPSAGPGSGTPILLGTL